MAEQQEEVKLQEEEVKLQEPVQVQAPVQAPALTSVTFNEIPKDTLAAGDLVRLTAMHDSLKALAVTWNALAAAGKEVSDDYKDEARTAAITEAHKALKESKYKIVNLTKIDTDNIVYLGGSRKRRQSKKRKNTKKHNNNQ
jgi:hypothetical protein